MQWFPCDPLRKFTNDVQTPDSNKILIVKAYIGYTVVSQI